MTSHENIHQRISVGTAKDHSLAVCHAFKIDRNAIRATGVKSVQKNIKPLEQLLLSVRKKISSVRMAEVFNSEFKTIQPIE